ncbi:hypothetical protein SAMN00768000_0663 [Sulfobacillus thermosulfidooxidans DSM 9293]|uniref:Spermatogenesis-associated protein 20-like TRX domain-containing protein n=1 Tax=Sulfobacillus thermosulfidooxidans (strain DSM 9293 / VKM B-1269 / AT-1) TaxID=929705 RepID=A0A1W1W8X2_SULTA|nr:DUF255 domain-containing protein [Sulfobacillus thermosulfidooxidans]SMC02579.1 hypothetical protein SAMN00768000_0663 [Sulfobacillus thermosulfidooxidans DSM 9293]
MAEPTFRFSPRPNRAGDIHWHEWTQDTFQQAQAEDKPILLSISAVWCHWCHVMDETTYSDPQIISRINSDFIPIRIDNDQRPDINQRYNMGGWPTTAFLTPAGEIITGGTYIAPEQMAPLLDQVISYWNEHKSEIADQLNPPAPPKINPHAEIPSPESVTKIMEAIRQQFDRAYGGLGVAPKFPQVDVWDLALLFFTATGDGWAAGMAVRTLDAMAGSALFDGIGGGFFRYSTTREWTIPHFEKMLDDNAQLAKLYLHAYQVLGDDTYRQIADAVLNWANKNLLNLNGLWGGSQDADEEYYRLPQEERDKRPAPFVDPIMYTHANAQMISAQLLAASLINPTVYAPIALTALEALWDRMWDENAGLYHYDNEGPKLPGQLIDVAHFTNTLIDGYEFTGDPIYLERAETLIAYADRVLKGENNGFYDQIEMPGAPGRLKHRQQPLNENALMARAFLRLGALFEDDQWTRRGQALVGEFSPMAEEQGVFGALWAIVADRAHAPVLSATVVQSHHRPGTALRQAIYGLYDRNRVVRTWPVGSPEFAQSGYPEIPVPALYICQGQTCSQPITEPEGILPALQQLQQAATAQVPNPGGSSPEA